MLTVTSYANRTSTLDGKQFFSLELTSDDPEIVLSANGRYYITTKKCYMSATFPEAVCKGMLGKQLPGTISKVECEPYEFVIPDTGEVITRNHRYEFLPVVANV
ncbi:hypothetical protein [Dyadobacter chenhuakuii]|uniref:Uncharacterized protein n=1 Tax=Dyadobacter chenhuakuii TaxID=2909339 RepID=A0A9X1QL71_9BACT|nr:hypothetical protein [Dyadobacter chenhuakuii]MCF2501694.1 hypothetical protein [Dyadobacter chenhuakuii]